MGDSKIVCGSIRLCVNCKKTVNKNQNCKSKYHYSPCTTVSKKTYDNMHADKRNEWKCHNCRKNKSPLPIIVLEETNQQKQSHGEDEFGSLSEENAKLSLTTLNLKLCSVKTDVSEMKTALQKLNLNINTGNNKIIEEIQNALTTITSNVTSLSTQVNELFDKNKETEKKISEFETRLNKIEQKAINKNIEINNVQNPNLSALDAIKNIASAINADLVDMSDISEAYKLKKRNRIIVSFTSLNKKREIMEKLKGHRIDAKLLNNNENNKTTTTSNNNNYIYINDELTNYNRRMLWLAKCKAKECNWKFVWARNGNIYARKTENSSFIIISNTADIESMQKSSN